MLLLQLILFLVIATVPRTAHTTSNASIPSPYELIWQDKSFSVIPSSNETLWIVNFNTPVGFGKITAGYGKIFVGFFFWYEDRLLTTKLIALNQTNGKIIWEKIFEPKGPIWERRVSIERVFMARDKVIVIYSEWYSEWSIHVESYLCALDQSTGKVEWEREFEPRFTVERGIIGVHENILFLNGEDYVKAINLTNGKTVWSRYKPKEVLLGCWKNKGVLSLRLESEEETIIRLLDFKTGIEIRRYKIDKKIYTYSGPLPIVSDKVYLEGVFGGVYALDLKTGESEKISDLDILEMAVNYDKLFLIAKRDTYNTRSNLVVAIDLATKKIVWEFETEEDVRKLIIGDRKILIGGGNSKIVYALDENGTLLWKFRNDVGGIDFTVAHGIVFIVDLYSRIYAVGRYVPSEKQRPIARLKVQPEWSSIGKEITIDASESYSVNSIISYFFEFGDGTVSGWISEPIIKKSYERFGEYLVRVKVKDSNGNVSEWSEKTKIIITSKYTKEYIVRLDVDEWVKTNCIPLLLLNTEGVDADTQLQDVKHRPTWYWRVLVDTFNHRFCVQLIGHWDEQVFMKCALDGHKWDYEPIFLYFTYEDDFYSSLRNGTYKYEYCFYSAEHWWTDWFELSGIEGSDVDDPEDQKLYFWNDSEGRKHPVFAIGLTNELLIMGILQWKTPILDGCPMMSRFVGHAYSRVRRYGITGPELIEEIEIEEFIEKNEEFGYEEFWPTDRQYDEDFFENYVKPLTDEVIDEWSKREENPFKMTPIFRSEGKVCEDLIDPWNEYFEGVYCVGGCFDPGCGYKGIEACYNISSIPEEGRWSEKMSYEAPECTELTFVLDWEREVNLDLHLWIEGMKVCGKNYETGEIEAKSYKVDDIMITVEYSGSEDRPEIIKLKAYSRVGGWNLRTKIPNLNYTVKVYARNVTEDPTFFLFEMARNKYSITREYKFEVEWSGEIYPVLIESNVSISSFLFNQSRKSIEFVSVCEGFVYFCNVSIPKSLLRDNTTHPWKIFVDENEIEYIPSGNETYSFIYFEFTGSGEINISILGAEVIPEFSGFVLVIIPAISTLFIVLLRKKKVH